MKKVLFLIVFLATATGSITAQTRNIARGAEPGELYIATIWYGIYDPDWGPPYYRALRTAVYRITENGKNLTIQYDANYFEENIDSVMYPFFILADATPGVIYNSVHYYKNWYEHTALWVSFDYGKKWTFREENIGAHYYYPANVEGLVYRTGMDGTYCSYDYAETFALIKIQQITAHEPGFEECDFFSLIGRGFYHTNDCFENYINITIDEEFVFGNVSGLFPDVFRGGLPGEVYIESWFPDWTFKVSFSADTGRTFRHVYVSEPFHPDAFKPWFMSDREPGVFYIIQGYQVEDTDPWGWHTKFCIDYYRDYGETLVDTYCHDVPKGYVNAIEEIGGMEEIVVFPNPTTGMLYVETHGRASLQNVEVFDLMGRTVGAINPLQKLEGCPKGGVVINISHLSTGLYFVRITTENSVVVRKVIKN